MDMDFNNKAYTLCTLVLARAEKLFDTEDEVISLVDAVSNRLKAYVKLYWERKANIVEQKD